MCSGYGDLTADGLERGAAAATAEVCKSKNKKESFSVILSRVHIKTDLVKSMQNYLEQYCRPFSLFSVSDDVK